MNRLVNEELRVFGRRLRQEREAQGLTRDILVERMSSLARERYGREIPEDSTKLARWASPCRGGAAWRSPEEGDHC